MISDVCILIITTVIVILIPFAIMTLIRLQKTLRSIQRDLRHTSIEAVKLMHKLEALTSDLQSKSDSLNFVFRPLKSLSKKESNSDVATEVVDWVALSLSLFDRLKHVVRHYGR